MHALAISTKSHMYPPRVIYSTLFFVLLMTLIFVSRPAALFYQDGVVRPFGVGPTRTVFPLGVITVVAATLSMYTFSMIDMIYG